MNNPIEHAPKKKTFSDVVKGVDIPSINKLISSFVGLEEEYKTLIENSENPPSTFFKDDKVVVINDPSISEVVTHAITISDMINKLKKELDVLSQNLKTYGTAKLYDWNQSNNDSAASVRIEDKSRNRTVMVTVKNSYSIDSKRLTELKKQIPSFEKAFSQETTWSIKNDKVKDVIAIIKNSLGKAGAAFIKEAFVENITYKVKSRKDLEELISSNEISDETRASLKEIIKQQEPSITYPK